MTSAASTQGAMASPPQPTAAMPIQNAASPPPNKRDLKSWWKGFKMPSKHQESHDARPAQGIFGVPLRQSITYANVAISLIDENGKSYIYGYVPIVVAKCGVYLKEKATGVEGIFRLSGSEKRIKELKTIFDSPDRYGKGLVWDGYTVHDAANVLRRYLNDLPEPVVPLDLYEKFRQPLRGATKQAVGDAEGPQFVDNFDEQAAIAKYQQLITELPPLNRQLLLYILDLLAVFAAKADENRMNSQNLAAIFQPGMLSHPTHAMAPEEYRLNQCVIIFLIENQDHFLIGMQGTATDEKTKQEIEKGAVPSKTPTTPNLTSRKSGLGRSASTASAGADSVRRDGKVRRNRSTASRQSRNEGSTTPGTPTLAVTPTGGLTRSNTVPSKKSPALAAGRFQKPDTPPMSATHGASPVGQPAGPAVEDDHTNTSEKSPASSSIIPPAMGPPSLAPGSIASAGRSQERLLEPSLEIVTPSKERNLQNLFQRSPTGESDKRQPNKLRKKRLPGSLNPSAQSSSASLSHSAAASPNVEVTNPMEHAEFTIPENAPVSPSGQASAVDTPSEPTPRASQVPSSNTLHPENTLKPKKSPPTSLHSSFNEGSDLDQTEGPPPPAQQERPDKEKERRRRWRLSRRKEDPVASANPPLTSPRMAYGSNDNAEVSRTSIGSSAYRPRKSFTGDSSDPTLASAEAQSSHESGNRERENKEGGKDDSKGPIGWIRSKYREAKENAEQKRNKSPPADWQGGGSNALPTRGKSVDIRREEEKMMNAHHSQLQLPQPPQQLQQQQPLSSPLPATNPPTQSTALSQQDQTK